MRSGGMVVGIVADLVVFANIVGMGALCLDEV